MDQDDRLIIDVALSQAANELVQEEIAKQVAHLARGVSDIQFLDGGARLRFSAPADTDRHSLEEHAFAIARNVQRSLRSLERKVVFRSSTAANPLFRGDGRAEGVSITGRGQAALRGKPLQLFKYFDRTFEEMGAEWNAHPLRTSTLIPVETLARCDYLRSFPHIVTFGTHLKESPSVINGFRERHDTRTSLDESAQSDLSTPEVALSPAVCYHAYALHTDETIQTSGRTYGACGKCFRFEASNLTDLRRLWDFTMREIIFMGGREDVLRKRERAVELVAEFLERHAMAAEIRTASDPFFIAPDSTAKAYFQLNSDTKYEVSACLPNGQRLAVGSLNYHSDFFGRAFNVAVQDAGAMHSVCIAFGIERWVYAFLCQHGNDPTHWPKALKDAPEFAGF